MAEDADATFWEVFSETSSTDLVRLLPWCISTIANPSVIPVCYMSEELTNYFKSEATHSKIHTQESEAEVHGQKKTHVQSLKQFHACFC